MLVASGDEVLRFAQDDMTHLTLPALARVPSLSPASRAERALTAGADQTPIVVRSWNQCWACTYDLILGDSACGLVSCTTQISTASSTTFSWMRAISASCLAASNVVSASLTSASTAGFE